ncbi:hypothetical protein SESBI_29816 [Sesbania bispinosa]|nr:hypothetical protein SESBI_29816 [Sesbania bispinosa]
MVNLWFDRRGGLTRSRCPTVVWELLYLGLVQNSRVSAGLHKADVAYPQPTVGHLEQGQNRYNTPEGTDNYIGRNTQTRL